MRKRDLAGLREPVTCSRNLLLRIKPHTHTHIVPDPPPVIFNTLSAPLPSMRSLTAIKLYVLIPLAVVGGVVVLLGNYFHPQKKASYQKLKGISVRESYGFFEYSDEQWERKKSNHRRQKQRQRGQIPSNKKNNSGRIFYQYNWEPSWSCGYEQRIGKIGDGGKWVCDAFKIEEALDCNVLSIGSNNDWSFEEAIFQLNPLCKIYTIDHTIVPKNKPSFVNWYNVGLGATKHDLISTMDEILQITGLSNSSIDILKIDCEGCEWRVYQDFFKGFFRQIMIELHDVGKNFEVNNFFEAMNDNGYVIFHKEPNTFGCSGDCIEYSFIRLNISNTI